MTPVKGYSEMKDSGIEWIGEIPSHWNIKRIKNLVTQKDSLFIDGDWINSEDISEEGIRYLTTGNVGQGYYKEQGNGYISEDTFKKLNCLEVYGGDLIISRLNEPVGRACIIPNKFPKYVVAVDNVVLRPDKEYNKKFLMYCMSCNRYAEYTSLLSRGTTMRRISRTQLGTIPLPIPSYNEQSAIAAYLDEQCSKIDEIIAEAKASIEDYKQWKASIIYEAVTKGLDPDAEMKDSGIEWIGKIPKGWGVCKTLYALSMPITDGPHTTPELFDDGIPFISAEAVSCGNGKIDFNHKRGYISQEFYEECCKKYTPQINDVYMIKSGATTGKVAIVDTDEIFTIWSPLAVFRANTNRILPMYLFYYLQSDAYQKEVELSWTYGTQQNIGMRTLETLKICLPPLSVQTEIIKYLDKNCSVISELITTKENLITDLESYKKSLIYEVVTGKRKVC